jgi:hypothetical protein
LEGQKRLTNFMKITLCLCAIMAASLTACSTSSGTHRRAVAKDPETVLVTYHVQAGKEAEFETVLSRAWGIYRREHLVFASPHLVVRDTEDGGKTRFVEIFTWKSHAIPEHAPEAVKTVWQQEQSLCEARNGHGGIGGGEVEIIAHE